MSQTDFRPCPMPQHGPGISGCVCEVEPQAEGWDGEVRIGSLEFDISVFTSQHDNQPKHRRVTWADLAAKLTPPKPEVVQNGRDRPAWSPASYPPDVLRRNATVRAVSLLVADVDDGTDPENVLDTLFPGHVRLVHTSWSHQREKKGITCARCRLVVPLSSAVPPAEWERVWRGMEYVAKQAGITIDSAVDSPSELYFRPCLRDAEQPWWFGVRDGAVLDWTEIPEAPATSKKKSSVISPLFGSNPISNTEARVAGMVRVEVEKIARAESRHEALLAGARYIGGLCARYGIDPTAHAASLLDAAGDSNDAARTCRDGFDYGRGQPCDLPPDRPLGNQTREPQPQEIDLPALAWLPHTDLGNAKRLDARHGINLRWSAARENWLVWLGTHWEWDEHELPHRWAQDTVERIAEEVAYWDSVIEPLGEQVEDEPLTITSKRKMLKAKRDSAKKHALASQATGRIKAAPTETKALRGRAIAMDDLDTDPWLFNTLSGTLDLRTGACRPHRRDDLITRIAPVVYQPDATCPRWLQFVETVFPDPDIRGFVQRAVGYSLTGDVSEQVWFLLKGEGSNGKSTMVETIRLMMGRYAIAVPGTVLEQQTHERHETELVDFKGARFAAGAEPRKGKRWDAEKVKRLTGEDRIKARGMREDFFEFDPSHKLWVAVNDAPSTDDTSHGFWRRLLMIPFIVQFRRPEDPDDGRPLADPSLSAALQQELPGILNWAMAGLSDWLQKSSLRVPKGCVMAAREYRREQDEVVQFIADCCESFEGGSTSSAQLFAAYRRWREGQGLPGRGPSSIQFGKDMTRAGIVQFEGRARVSMRSGIRLKADEPPQEEEEEPSNW